MNGKSKKFILLTGPPGVGKTTLIRGACEILRKKNYKLAGFFTEEVRETRERIGFDVVLLDGRRAPLARVTNSDSHKGPKVGKYTVNVNTFESLCLSQFNTDENTILVLDEIGKMELFSDIFKEKVDECFKNGSQVILGTLPIKTANPIPFVEKLKYHPSSLLINVDRTNRCSLLDQIVKHVSEASS